jgi:hypothetical protein
LSTAEYDEDALLDAVALVDAVRRDDMPAVAVIVHNSSWMQVMVALAKLMAVAADESQACPGYFREWAANAIDRR